MARKRDDTIKLVLRLPPALHQRLRRAAARKNQSLNSEMIQRLEESLRGETAEIYRGMRELNDHMARRGKTTLFGRPITELNKELDKTIAQLEAEEAEEKREKK